MIPTDGGGPGLRCLQAEAVIHDVFKRHAAGALFERKHVGTGRKEAGGEGEIPGRILAVVARASDGVVGAEIGLFAEGLAVEQDAELGVVRAGESEAKPSLRVGGRRRRGGGGSRGRGHFETHAPGGADVAALAFAGTGDLGEIPIGAWVAAADGEVDVVGEVFRVFEPEAPAAMVVAMAELAGAAVGRPDLPELAAMADGRPDEVAASAYAP